MKPTKPPKPLKHAAKPPKALRIKHGEHRDCIIGIDIPEGGEGDDPFFYYEIVFTCSEIWVEDGEDKLSSYIYRDPRNARAIGEWLIKVADWAEKQTKRRKK